jgi:hypothetical protein
MTGVRTQHAPLADHWVAELGGLLEPAVGGLLAPAAAPTGLAIVSASGLEYTDHVVGDGEEARPGAVVRVHYTGTLAADGSTFDCSRQRGQPISFTLGNQQVRQRAAGGGRRAERARAAGHKGLGGGHRGHARRWHAHTRHTAGTRVRRDGGAEPTQSSSWC